MTNLNTGKYSDFRSEWDDKYYTAYALIEGNISGHLKGVALSVGLHVRTLCAGTVLLLGHDPDNNRFESLGKLNGKQPGELFGASMIVSDINGDGLDDIIVGAPHYTDYNDYEIKFEIGAVYVYHQRTFASEERFRESDTILRGKHDGGRFGHAVAALGDVNGDDFNDVAVGAPYEGSGVVYIYHGSESGQFRCW